MLTAFDLVGLILRPLEVGNKKGADPERSAPIRSNLVRQSDAPHVGGLQALGALGDLELHGVTLVQAPEPLHCDGGMMHEDIVAVRAGDKAKTLGIIEPLHFAFFHSKLSCSVGDPSIPGAAGVVLSSVSRNCSWMPLERRLGAQCVGRAGESR